MAKPYLQGFLFTMENGAVVKVLALGEDSAHGEGLAHEAAQDLTGVQVWDSCAYPVTSEETERGESVRIMQEATDKES